MKPTDHLRRLLTGSLALAAFAGLARRTVQAAGSAAGALPSDAATPAQTSTAPIIAGSTTSGEPTAAVGAGRATSTAVGAGLPHLAEDDPAAKGLAYVDDAVRAQKITGFVPGSRCDNCLQLQGNAGDPFRPCPLFPGKLVSAAGWCKSWTPEI